MRALTSSFPRKTSSLSRRKSHNERELSDLEKGESDTYNTEELNEKQESEISPIEDGHIYEITKRVRESMKQSDIDSKVISLGLVHLGIQSPGEVSDEPQFKSIEGDKIKEDAMGRMFKKSGHGGDKCHSVLLESMGRKSMKQSDIDSKVISLGLVHLGIQSPGEVSDKIKDHAMGRMFKKSGHEGDKCHSVLSESIETKLPEIKSFYPNIQIDKSDEELAKLVVRDACFLLQALFLLTREESWSGWEETRSEWPRLGIFQQKHGNVKLDAVLQDILKLENQIPLFVLKEVANKLENWASNCDYEISQHFTLEDVLKAISPIHKGKSCFKKYQRGEYMNNSNLLCLLRDYMIENPGKEAYETKAERNPNSWWRYIGTMSVLTVQTFLFVFFRLVITMVKEKRSVESLVLVISLALSTIISLAVALLGSSRFYGSNLQSRVVSLRTRIRIRACEGGIESIKFKTAKFNLFNLGSLYLPSIELNDTTEVILKNMIAFEIARASVKKSVTNYVKLMNQLIHSRYDVRVMVSDGVIKYNGWGRKKVRQLWQDLSELSQRLHGWSDLRLDNVDAVRGELYRISNLSSCDLRVIIRILFYDMIDRFCSKPWIALSTMAAITMLLLTGAQVLCLFYKCSAV